MHIFALVLPFLVSLRSFFSVSSPSPSPTLTLSSKSPGFSPPCQFRSSPILSSFTLIPVSQPVSIQQRAGRCARPLGSRQLFISPLSFYYKMTPIINDQADTKQTACSCGSWEGWQEYRSFLFSVRLFIWLEGPGLIPECGVCPTHSLYAQDSKLTKTRHKL